MRQPAEKNGQQTVLFENGVKSNVGGCIGTACKSLKTVQAKQYSPKKSASAKRKAPYFLRSTVLFLVENTGPFQITVNSCSPCTALFQLSYCLTRLGQTKVPDKQKSTTHCCAVLFFLVENTGIEPVTSCMPCKRSPEPRTHAPPRKGARMDDIWRYNALFRERHILTQKQRCCLNEFH